MFERDPLANPEPLIQRVYAYVAYRIGDGPDAEDVTSATFERALRYRESFDPRRGEPLAWLIGIARGCLAEAREGGAVPVADLPEVPDPGDQEDTTLRRLWLAAAVAHLDERDRELVALRYGADLTARQIADLLDLRTNAEEVALHRALARLPGELEALADKPAPAGRPLPTTGNS
jgi:RNA polymerase sigma-70 factor (ECF subfamily)